MRGEVSMDLKCENVSVSIGEKNIVNDISFCSREGQFTTIVGPNGCGKSTLLKSIYRIQKMDRGVIYLNGKDMKEIKVKESAKSIAVVSQFNNINFDYTVKEIVTLGRTPHLKMFENEKQIDFEIVEDAIAKVGLQDKVEQSYLSLSGGEKQRVILARAIAQQPTLLLLDEPLNHLDIKYQLEILKVVKGLKINVVAVLHDLQLASMFSDQIYFMKDGKIVANGIPEEVVTKENIKEVYDIECEVTHHKHGSVFISYQ